MVKMSGNGRSAVERVEEYKLKLAAKCKKMSLPEAQCRQIEHYVNMKRSELQTLSEVDLCEIAYELEAYAYYLQGELNWYQMTAKHVRYMIKKTIGKDIEGYKHIYGNESQWDAAILDNDFATQLREIEHNNQMMIELLSYRANDLDRVSKSILEIKRSRRRFDG
jgi:hypothetical protein